jgi:hypothetical protein
MRSTEDLFHPITEKEWVPTGGDIMSLSDNYMMASCEANRGDTVFLEGHLEPGSFTMEVLATFLLYLEQEYLVESIHAKEYTNPFFGDPSHCRLLLNCLICRSY